MAYIIPTVTLPRLVSEVEGTSVGLPSVHPGMTLQEVIYRTILPHLVQTRTTKKIGAPNASLAKILEARGIKLTEKEFRTLEQKHNSNKLAHTVEKFKLPDGQELELGGDLRPERTISNLNDLKKYLGVGIQTPRLVDQVHNLLNERGFRSRATAGLNADPKNFLEPSDYEALSTAVLDQLQKYRSGQATARFDPSGVSPALKGAGPIDLSKLGMGRAKFRGAKVDPELEAKLKIKFDKYAKDYDIDPEVIDKYRAKYVKDHMMKAGEYGDEDDIGSRLVTQVPWAGDTGIQQRFIDAYNPAKLGPEWPKVWQDLKNTLSIVSGVPVFDSGGKRMRDPMGRPMSRVPRNVDEVVYTYLKTHGPDILLDREEGDRFGVGLPPTILSHDGTMLGGRVWQESPVSAERRLRLKSKLEQAHSLNDLLKVFETKSASEDKRTDLGSKAKLVKLPQFLTLMEQVSNQAEKEKVLQKAHALGWGSELELLVGYGPAKKEKVLGLLKRLSKLVQVAKASRLPPDKINAKLNKLVGIMESVLGQKTGTAQFRRKPEVETSGHPDTGGDRLIKVKEWFAKEGRQVPITPVEMKETIQYLKAYLDAGGRIPQDVVDWLKDAKKNITTKMSSLGPTWDKEQMKVVDKKVKEAEAGRPEVPLTKPHFRENLQNQKSELEAKIAKEQLTEHPETTGYATRKGWVEDTLNETKDLPDKELDKLTGTNTPESKEEKGFGHLVHGESEPLQGGVSSGGVGEKVGVGLNPPGVSGGGGIHIKGQQEDLISSMEKYWKYPTIRQFFLDMNNLKKKHRLAGTVPSKEDIDTVKWELLKTIKSPSGTDKDVPKTFVAQLTDWMDHYLGTRTKVIKTSAFAKEAGEAVRTVVKDNSTKQPVPTPTKLEKLQLDIGKKEKLVGKIIQTMLSSDTAKKEDKQLLKAELSKLTPDQVVKLAGQVSNLKTGKISTNPEYIISKLPAGRQKPTKDEIKLTEEVLGPPSEAPSVGVRLPKPEFEFYANSVPDMATELKEGTYAQPKPKLKPKVEMPPTELKAQLDELKKERKERGAFVLYEPDESLINS